MQRGQVLQIDVWRFSLLTTGGAIGISFVVSGVDPMQQGRQLNEIRATETYVGAASGLIMTESVIVSM